VAHQQITSAEAPSSVDGPRERPMSPGGVALCAACHRLGGCRLGLQTEVLEDDGSVTTELVCDESYEGGPGVAHGGWTAGALDELVGHVVLQHRRMSVTGKLTVSFLKPVPINRPLRATARRVREENGRWFVHAGIALAATGTVLATAEGEMVLREWKHFARFQEWLAGEDAKS
jgi:acyl-coenzyme A thioesterase PaaI-like protein